MAYNYIALDMNLIPQETKDNVSAFLEGTISNDNTRYLMPGYNHNGDLVQDSGLILSMLQWEKDPQAKLNELISPENSYVMTLKELKAAKLDPQSIWYDEEVDL